MADTNEKHTWRRLKGGTGVEGTKWSASPGAVVAVSAEEAVITAGVDSGGGPE